MVDNYYVYKHIDEDGSIVYVGKGRYSRAWRHERRNGEHSTWMAMRLPFLNVQIDAFNLDEVSAFRIEAELIVKLQPKFNVDKTEAGILRKKSFGKWLSETHSRFHDSELQRELGKRAVQSPNHPNKINMTCDHCGVTMLLGHIKRYHNDNCKKRVDNNDVS
jgi:excinuclease UvrABC nuclease subunit